MALPVVEITTLTASDAYKQDPRILIPALALLKTVNGVIDIWHGTQLQDPSKFWVVVLWETLEQEQKYTTDNAIHAHPRAALAPAIASFEDKALVAFPADIRAALDAPVTETAVWVLHEGVDRAAFLERNRELERTFYSDMPDEIFRGSIGPVVENDKRVAVVFGWHSLERFVNAVHSNSKCVELITELKERAELDLKHAHLTKFEKH